jgi:hypothetical protein
MSPGLTLIEVVIGTALFVTGAATLLLGMHYAMIHSSFVRQSQVAMNAAQARLEQLAATNIDTLLNMAGALAGRLLEAPGDPDWPANAPFAALPNARLAIQIRTVPPGAPAPNNIVDIHVAACWTHRGRTIGEGGADATGVPRCQDTSGDPATWAVDSPVMVSTRIARRE